MCKIDSEETAYIKIYRKSKLHKLRAVRYKSILPHINKRSILPHINFQFKIPLQRVNRKEYEFINLAMESHHWQHNHSLPRKEK